MSTLRRTLLCLLALTPAAAAADGHGWRVSGFVSGEARYFWQEPLDPVQPDANLSFAARPEFYRDWNDGRDSVNFIPFARVDQHDDERTHFDVRELKWQRVGPDWELRVGADVVFSGHEYLPAFSCTEPKPPPGRKRTW